MASHTMGIGKFTTDNICVVLEAVKQSNGTYRDVAEQATELGVSLSPHTIAMWVSNGRADIRRQRRDSAYGQFAQEFDERRKAHCDPESNRRKELQRALMRIASTCECGREKAIRSDGTLSETCAECERIDSQRDNRGKRR